MPIASADLISVLSGLRPFNELDQAQLELVAAAIDVLELAEGEALSLPANRDYPFFVIAEGRVRQKRKLPNGSSEEFTFKQEDSFGAEILLTGGRRIYQIKALQKTKLLKIEAAKLAPLLRTIPALKVKIREQLIMNRFLRRKIFSWVSEHESVHLIVRQHPAFLLVLLLRAVVLGWFALLVFIFSTLIEAASFRLVVGWVALGLGIVATLWALWVFFDWLNDYYIVTDQRVVWLERVIFIYESRQEAPLSAVKSEEVKTTLLGRLLGFGDVVTLAFLGQVTFRGIAYPYTVREVIERLRKRAEEDQVKADKEKRAEILRGRLNPSPQSAPPAPAPVVGRSRSRKATRVHQSKPLGLRFREYFQTYIKEGNVITYRKHIFILLKKVWVPTTLTLFILIAAVYLHIQLTTGAWTGTSRLTLILVALGFYLPVALWWLYQYVDWRNDIYQITDDKIIDSERKPLGTEITKSAPLESILSLDYERIGLLGVLLNMGNVIINTGTDKLIWLTITNPARAQREIFNRMLEQRNRKKVAESSKQSEQHVDWIETYEDYRKDQEHTRQENPPPS